MSVEYALEKYPITAALKNGKNYEIRPLRREDEVAFHDFYKAIPDDERSFLKYRVTDRTVFHEWCESIDYESNLPLLALLDGHVVGDATLHQRKGGWKRHIGLVSLLVHPEHRDIGMAKALITELVDIARHAGMAKLEVEFTGERKVAIETFASLGFAELMRLKDYVRDMNTRDHDYVLMGMDLVTDEEFANAV